LIYVPVEHERPLDGDGKEKMGATGHDEETYNPITDDVVPQIK
jgi:hypothetical protein